MFISDFRIVKKSLCLLDEHDEMSIDKIAVYRSNNSKFSFVYIETKPLKSTGLYDNSRIEAKIKERGFYPEPYALLGKRIISIDDYNDNSTVVNGKVILTNGAISRLRHVSKYNFIIASQQSPYNSRYFDIGADDYLNGILAETHSYDQLMEFMKSCRENFDSLSRRPDPWADFLD